MPIITTAGAYPDIEMSDYHGNPDLLPGPSLSSSGAKKIISHSALHFWWSSAMNPAREEESKPAFNVGKAAHDMILMGGDWESKYFVLPEGFRENAVNKFAGAIEELRAAREAGVPVLRFQDAAQVRSVATAIMGNRDALNALTDGIPELTIAHKDTETGIWCKTRPDWLPYSVINGAPVMVVSDLKFLAMTHCRPHGFAKAILDFGFHQSAAWYEDGIEAIYGRRPTNWIFIAVEKDAPHSVSVYEMPREDIERGRFQNQKARRIFAECLDRDRWPSYTTDEIQMVGLPIWARRQIDEHGDLNSATLIQSFQGATA